MGRSDLLKILKDDFVACHEKRILFAILRVGVKAICYAGIKCERSPACSVRPHNVQLRHRVVVVGALRCRLAFLDSKVREELVIADFPDSWHLSRAISFYSHISRLSAGFWYQGYNYTPGAAQRLKSRLKEAVSAVVVRLVQ